jgi:hypothetical protein
MLFLTAGLILFFLPFSLYSYQPSGWRSSLVLCMLIFGIILLASFTLYERFLAPKIFIP